MACGLTRPNHPHAAQDLRLLLDTFASRPGQPFALLLLPCDQFQSLHTRVGSSLQRLRNLGASSNSLETQAADAALAATAAVRALCASYGLHAPAVRVLAPGDVNGAAAHPVWTFLKAAYGDTSDIGWNFGCDARTAGFKPHSCARSAGRARPRAARRRVAVRCT